MGFTVTISYIHIIYFDHIQHPLSPLLPPPSPPPFKWHLFQVIPLSPLLTRSILDPLMPQTDEDFTRTVDLNALSSLKSPIQTYSHIPVSRWLRQGDGDFDANLGYKVIPLFKR